MLAMWVPTVTRVVACAMAWDRAGAQRRIGGHMDLLMVTGGRVITVAFILLRSER